MLAWVLNTPLTTISIAIELFYFDDIVSVDKGELYFSLISCNVICDQCFVFVVVVVVVVFHSYVASKMEQKITM